jgi:glycosyltransferase involved in cell wall biosynthesis
VPARRLLFLSPEFPDPAGNGGELRLFQIVGRLAERGDATIRLIAPAPAEKVARASQLRDVGVDLRPVVRPASRLREAVAASVADPRVGAAVLARSWMAWQAAVYRHELRGEVARALAEPWDGAVIEHDWALGWARDLPRDIPLGLVFQNLTDVLLERRAAGASGLAKLRTRRDARLARSEVDRAIGRVSQAFACSEDDAAEIERRWEVPSAVVPNGADVERLASISDEGITPGRLLFAGTMSYQPNADAARWLGEEIFPAVRERRPDATLSIVGRDPPASVRALASKPGVDVPGRVADLEPWLAGAEVVLAPMLSGSGTKLKVIEAMAAGRPVVATAIGAEGIEATDDELRVADGADRFADAVVELLDDPARARRIGAAARALAAARYSWDASASAMDAAIECWLQGEPERQTPHTWR